MQKLCSNKTKAQQCPQRLVYFYIATFEPTQHGSLDLQGLNILKIVDASVVADTNIKGTNYEIEGAVYIPSLTLGFIGEPNIIRLQGFFVNFSCSDCMS